MDAENPPHIRTQAYWFPFGASGRILRRRPLLRKGRISTSRYRKRPRRLAEPDSKIRWIWWRRHHTTKPWVRAVSPDDAAGRRERILRELRASFAYTAYPWLTGV